MSNFAREREHWKQQISKEKKQRKEKEWGVPHRKCKRRMING